MKAIALPALVALAGYAMFVTAAGGGVDDPAGGICTAGSDNGCNPRVGLIFGDCVELQGEGWAPATCGRPNVVSARQAETVAAGAAGEFGATGGSGALTYEGVRDLWIAAGGDPAQANVAAAVATAESGRRPSAVNGSNSDGSIDRGLFQMNSIHGGCSTFDLAENVRCAVELQRSGGWRHWVAYQTGAYRKFLEA